MAYRSLCLWLNLLGGIVLKADRADEVQLGLQPLNVFLALDDQVLEELSRAGIALLQAEGDPLCEWGQCTRFQLQIPLQQILEVPTCTESGWCSTGRPSQEEESVDQPLGITHFLERFLIDLLVQTEVPPVLTHTLRHAENTG